MICNNCGVEIPNGTQYCPNCGNAVTNVTPSYQQQPYQQQPYQQTQQISMEDAGVGLKILSFFIPLIGLILWLVKRNNEPVGAKSLLYCAIAGFVVEIIYTWLW